MKYIATLAFAILFSGAAIAQFGIKATYRTNDAPNWLYTDAAQNIESILPEFTVGIGLDYWIPMKAYRIDFVPELNFSRMNNTIETGNSIETNEVTLNNTWFSLFLNTNIYFLDLEGDCDCPTFSKSGGALQKGLFLQLSPGVSWIKSKLEKDGMAADSDDATFSMAAALGLDVGLSDMLTLTPMVGFRYYLPTQWESLSSPAFFGDGSNGEGIMNEKSSIRQFYAGLRVGLRLDQR